MNLLSVKNLSVSFGGVQALSGVNFDVPEGTIYAIIGPNGAGKTTLFNNISGIYKPNEGQIIFNNTEIQGMRPDKIARLGVARTFQNIELFAKMTTLDNLLLGRHLYMKTGLFSGALMFRRGSKAARDEIKHREKVEEIIDFLDLQSARHLYVSGLPYGIQKKVELGRALALEPKLLLLDEPSAGMNMEEKQDLMIWMKDIQERFKVTCLLIEHDMKLVMDISDKITVINYGRKIAEGKPEEIQNHPEVLKAYLGED
jgi:branched-chain amino acid transport system ATP-binding protein